MANRPLWINTGTLCVSYLTKDVSKDEDADNHAEKSGEAFSKNDLGLVVGCVVCLDFMFVFSSDGRVWIY